MIPAWLKKEHTSQGLSKEGSYQVPSSQFKFEEKKVIHKGITRGGWDDEIEKKPNNLPINRVSEPSIPKPSVADKNEDQKPNAIKSKDFAMYVL